VQPRQDWPREFADEAAQLVDDLLRRLDVGDVGPKVRSSLQSCERDQLTHERRLGSRRSGSGHGSRVSTDAMSASASSDRRHSTDSTTGPSRTYPGAITGALAMPHTATAYATGPSSSPS
jgi:hypothetical protein